MVSPGVVGSDSVISPTAVGRDEMISPGDMGRASDTSGSFFLQLATYIKT